MPAGYDDAPTLLTTLDDAIREVYYDSLIDNAYRFGSMTNRIFGPKMERINGDGKNYQTKTGHMYSATIGRDLYADAVRARSFTVDKFKATLSETAGGTGNDFSVIDNAIEIKHFDLRRAADQGAHALGDLAQTLVNEMIANDGELLAKSRNLPSSGLIGTIATGGGLKADDNDDYAAASSFSSAPNGRIKLSDTTPISYFQRNVLIDVYDSASDVVNDRVMVTNVNPADNSIGVVSVDANGEPDATNLAAANLAAGDRLYFRDGFGKGMKSLGAWFVAAGSSGESFFTKDRTDPDNRWMLPTVVGPSSSSPMSFSYLRALGSALYQTGGEEVKDSFVYQMHPDMRDTMIDLVQAETIQHVSAVGNRGSKMLQYGFEGSVYNDPYLGVVSFTADPLAPKDQIRAVLLGTWETLHPMPTAFEILPGDMGSWYRKQSSTADGTRSKVYRQDRVGVLCDVCTLIDRNGLIRNVTPLV